MAITLRTDFPGGNGVLLDQAERPGAPTVRFAAEARNCPQTMWFHFRLGGLAGRGVRVVLANPEQALGGPDWSANALVHRPPGGSWARTDPPERLECAGGRIEWAWTIDNDDDDEIEVAHCYPYQPADLAATLGELDGAFAATMIGLTLAGRQLLRLQNRVPQPGEPAVFLTARAHAGETPGSWVLDGLLRRVADDAPLRNRLAWWAVPFLNLDDVVEGSYGKDPHPVDCNRSFGPGSPRRPEAGAVIADVRRLLDRTRIGLYCDIHAPSHSEPHTYVPLRGWDTDSTVNPIAQDFAERFARTVPERLRSPLAHKTPAPGPGSPYPGLSGTRWAAEALGLDAITLEVSYQGNGQLYYTIDDYRAIGSALADTIADWVLGGADAPRGAHGPA